MFKKTMLLLSATAMIMPINGVMAESDRGSKREPTYKERSKKTSGRQVRSSRTRSKERSASQRRSSRSSEATRSSRSSRQEARSRQPQ